MIFIIFYVIIFWWDYKYLMINILGFCDIFLLICCLEVFKDLLLFVNMFVFNFVVSYRLLR